MDKTFFKKYFSLVQENLDNAVINDLIKVAELAKNTAELGRKLIIAGNGGSAAMASHVCVDFTKVAKVRAINFNEADLITCFSNDYGYEHAYQKAIEFYGDKDDLLILISSSGNSPNIINAANYGKKAGLSVVTLSGFKSSNKLKNLGDVNIWVDCESYNIVEMTHHIMLLSIVDYIVGDIYYSAN
jgi:D-sedoheptulose 7-phosphate isomerase